MLLIIFICTASLSKAQTLDSLSNDLKLLKGSIIYMRNNLNEAHKEFRTGAVLSMGGLTLIGVGAVINSGDASNPNSSGGIFIFIGSIAGLIGGIMIIDSHKFIGRAGNWRFEGNTIKYDF